MRTIALAFTAMSFAAYGQFPEWVTAASACVPDEASAGMFQMTGARFSFTTAPTGEIEARCNVTNPRDDNFNPLWSRMEVTFTDQDGMNVAAQIIADLVVVDKFTGNSAVIATFSSSAFPAGTTLATVPVPPVFNFINNAYYINLRVRRSSNNWMPWVARVRLYRD
jgi:hypothetical protein